MTINAALKTVSIQSDTGSLLQALKATFTNSRKALTELAQNARRAGASKVEFCIDEDLITVVDDGCGIDDFSVLLWIAKSGWNEDVQREDGPYGLGFLAGILACEEIGVMSKGYHLFARTSDLLALKPQPINESADLGFTEIRLHGHSLGETKLLEEFLRVQLQGFPIPVFVNGHEIERRHAASGAMVKTAIGLVNRSELLRLDVGSLYLQGLPVKVPRRALAPFGDFSNKPIHLDSTQFRGRMPDRDELLEADTALPRIRDALIEAARAELEVEFKSMKPEEFIQEYGAIAVKLDMRDLLNSIDCIPGHWVSSLEETPRLTWGWEDYTGPTGPAPITRDSLEQRGIFSIPGRIDRETLVCAHFVAGRKAFLDKDIPQWHWASEIAVDLDPEDFTAETDHSFGSEEMWIDGEDITLEVVKALRLRHDTLGVIEAEMALIEGTLYSTPDALASTLARQISIFSDEGGMYDEDAEDQAVDQICNAIRSLVHKDAAGCLLSALNQKLSELPRITRGKRYTLEISDTGGFTVTLDASPTGN